MWDLVVEGDSDTIYPNLRNKFRDEHTREVEVGPVIKMRRGEARGRGKEMQADEGVSEQFRRIAKSVQTLTPMIEGQIRVTCGGEPGKSLYLKVEAKDAP